MKNKIFALIFLCLFCTLFAQNKAAVYLDVSKSMRAYMSQHRLEANTYIDLLLNLNAILVASGYDESVIKLLGSSIMAVVPMSGISRFANVRKTNAAYNQDETNLVGALNDILAAGNSLNLVITDAVLSKLDGADQSDCSIGYDLGCFMNRFADIIDKKWSIQVIGITSWFQGTYYSELLRMRGAKDYKLPVAEGIPRPFYIFAIGLDRQKTQTFANKVENWFFQSYGQKHAFLKIRKLKISPYNAPKIALIGEMPQFLTDNRNDAIFSLTGEPNKYRRVPKKMKGDFLKLVFNAELRFSESMECAPYFSFENEVSLSPKAGNKECKIDIESKGLTKRFSVYFSPGYVGKMGSQAVLNIRLWPRFRHNNKLVWEDWSTPNDALEENVGKTMNISSLLSYILDLSLSKTRIPAENEVKKKIVFVE